MVDWCGGRGCGVEGSSKKEKGLMDTENSLVIAVRVEWLEVEEAIRGVNGKGKNTIKIDY